jgi:hypothetical protein
MNYSHYRVSLIGTIRLFRRIADQKQSVPAVRSPIRPDPMFSDRSENNAVEPYPQDAY